MLCVAGARRGGWKGRRKNPGIFRFLHHVPGDLLRSVPASDICKIGSTVKASRVDSAIVFVEENGRRVSLAIARRRPKSKIPANGKSVQQFSAAAGESCAYNALLGFC